MKWSFNVAAQKAEIAAKLHAEVLRLVDGINKAEEAKALEEKRELTPIAHADYVPELEAVCTAAETIAQQLPDTPDTKFAVNCFGEIESDHRTGELRASANLSVVQVQG